MDPHTLSEESYKRGYENGFADAKSKFDTAIQNADAGQYECLILTENVDGARRLIVSKRLTDLWADWHVEATMCPENDAPVYLFVLGGNIVCANDGWDFEDVMNRIHEELAGS